MTPGLYYYYLSELAFYWSLVFSQFTDIKRKVSRTGVVWSTFPTAVMVVIILDGHMFVVLWSWVRNLHPRSPPMSVEALYVHPLSCDRTDQILLEIRDFHWIETRRVKSWIIKWKSGTIKGPCCECCFICRFDIWCKPLLLRLSCLSLQLTWLACQMHMSP